MTPHYRYLQLADQVENSLQDIKPSNYSLPVLSAGQEFVAWQRAGMVNFNAANLATLVSSAAPFFVAPVLKIYWLDLSFVTGHK